MTALNTLGDLLIKAILSFPLHGLCSRSIMLMTFSGRKSGKIYTIPVNYLRHDSTLSVLSRRPRLWWRTLRGEARLTLRLRGQDRDAWGDVIEDEQGVVTRLMAYLHRAPRYAKYLWVGLAAGGQPRVEDVAMAARTMVMVQIEIIPRPLSHLDFAGGLEDR